MNVTVVRPAPTMEVTASVLVAGRRVSGLFGVSAVGDDLTFLFVHGEDVEELTVPYDVFANAVADAQRLHATAPRRGLRRRRDPIQTQIMTESGRLAVVADRGTVTLRTPFHVTARSRLRSLHVPGNWTCTESDLRDMLIWAAAMKSAEAGA